MMTVFHYTPVNAKQFDELNIDGLAGKRQKRQNFPPSKFCTIQCILSIRESIQDSYIALMYVYSVFNKDQSMHDGVLLFL